MNGANCACLSKVNFSLKVPLRNTLRRLLTEGCSFSTILKLAYIFFGPPSLCRYDLFISSGSHNLLLSSNSTKGASITNCSTLDKNLAFSFTSFSSKGDTDSFPVTLESFSAIHYIFLQNHIFSRMENYKDFLNPGPLFT